MTLVEVVACVAIVGILVALLIPAIQMARESARRTACSAKLHQIGTALHAYESAYAVFPPPVLHWTPGGPWNQNVPLLPHLAAQPLYQALNIGLSRHDTANTTVSRLSPDMFLCPSDAKPRGSKYGLSSYQASMGSGRFPGGIDAPIQMSLAVALGADGFFASMRMSTDQVTDGLSHTAAFAEQVHGGSVRGKILPRPTVGFIYEFEVLPPTQRQVLSMCEDLTTVTASTKLAGEAWLFNSAYTHLLTPGKASCFGGNISNAFSPITASSRHSRGVNMLLADGHVRFCGSSIDNEVWRSLGSRNGNETIEF